MSRIMIIGSVAEEKIRAFCAELKTEADFNIPCRTTGECDGYDAVFFCEPFNRAELKYWIGNNHLRISAGEKELKEEILFFAGNPYPLEIERKFLVKLPSGKQLDSIENSKSVRISQAYCRDENGNFRVRRRQNGDSVSYIRTEKIKISEIRRLEKETVISEKEYADAVRGRKVISKIRLCFLYKDKYFELDIFPFWRDTAMLEIELKSENESFEFPDFLEKLQEVTWDPAYKNSVLAEKYGTISC